MMFTKSHKLRGDQGAALLVAMIFMITAGLVATYVVTRVVSHNYQVTHHIEHMEAYHGLEAGTAQLSAELNQANNNAIDDALKDGYIGVDPAFDFTRQLPDFGVEGVEPVRLASNQDIEFFAYQLFWDRDGRDNNGDGEIDMGAEAAGGFSSIIAQARVVRNGETLLTRRTEMVSGDGEAVSIWKNAIFAGSGQAGALINGNVSIHGSVHLLGDNLDDNDDAIATIEAMELGGTSLIHNNYDGIPDDLAWRIPGLDTTIVEGNTLEYLEAELRVKNGMVSMNGNSEIGQPESYADGYKGAMDGIYVSDGWTGNQVVDGAPKEVYSDNGFEMPYDMGAHVDFPTYQNDGGRVHVDYYLETNADSSIGLQVPHDGDMTIEPGAGSFYYNATTGDLVEGGTPGDGDMPSVGQLNPDEFYVWFDDGSDTMRINGRVPIDGNLNILAGDGISNESINYEGKGSFLTYDSGGSESHDVTLEVNLLTTGFPHTNLIGIHAEDNFVIGTNSQISIMGGFYAQNEIFTDKQTTIMGSIVGSYFNMGRNVPDIYQVPELQHAWEDYMRMIGANPSFFPVQLAWVEYNVL